MKTPAIIPYGPDAVLIDFGPHIDPEVHQRVTILLTYLQTFDWPGLRSLVPAYSSITVVFAPGFCKLPDVEAAVLSCEMKLSGTSVHDEVAVVSPHWRIPVCYEAPFALDKEELCTSLDLSWPEIVALHTAQSYRVYLLGFLPGFPYLGKLPGQLQTSRRAIPRKQVAACSVAIAGLQTGIYPFDAPGGWNIMGKTPLPIVLRGEQPFWLLPGHEVSFYAVSNSEFDAFQDKIAHLNGDDVHAFVKELCLTSIDAV